MAVLFLVGLVVAMAVIMLIILIIPTGKLSCTVFSVCLSTAVRIFHLLFYFTLSITLKLGAISLILQTRKLRL